MASKRKPKARNNNWIQLKSHLWKEFKGEAYDWNSKKFNQLVTETYYEIGKKDYTKVPRVGLIARGLEEQTLRQIIGQTYQIPYYEIGRTLDAFKDDPTYQGFKVVTKFDTPEFKDEKFDAEAFEYEGSQLQGLVRSTDEFRATNPTKSPPHKVTVEVIPEKKLIKMYTGTPEAPAEAGSEPKAKKPKAYKQIKATPASTANIKNTIKENKDRIKELNRDLKSEKNFIIPLLRINTQMNLDLLDLSSENIRNWGREVKKLTKENEDLEKQLSKQGKGYVAKRKKRK